MKCRRSPSANIRRTGVADDDVWSRELRVLSGSFSRLIVSNNAGEIDF
jgi:hypothetical protein